MRQPEKKRLRFFRGHRGISLIETLVALAIIGAITVTFLSGLITASKAAFTADEQTTAESLAQSQMEWVKNATYVEGATQYPPALIPSGSDYINYSAVIAVEPLHNPDDGIQEITVIIKRFDETIITLEGYKRQR